MLLHLQCLTKNHSNMPRQERTKKMITRTDPVIPETLKPGTIIDRYGSPYGRYFSPYKTPIEMRALLPSNNMQYNAYIVVKSIDVQRSIVAPAFGKLGYGIQYKTPLDVNSLIEFKFIIPIK